MRSNDDIPYQAKITVKYHHLYFDRKYTHTGRCETQTQLWQPDIDLELGSVDLMTMHTRYLRNPNQILLVKFVLGGVACHGHMFTHIVNGICLFPKTLLFLVRSYTLQLLVGKDLMLTEMSAYNVSANIASISILFKFELDLSVLNYSRTKCKTLETTIINI